MAPPSQDPLDAVNLKTLGICNPETCAGLYRWMEELKGNGVLDSVQTLVSLLQTPDGIGLVGSVIENPELLKSFLPGPASPAPGVAESRDEGPDTIGAYPDYGTGSGHTNGSSGSAVDEYPDYAEQRGGGGGDSGRPVIAFSYDDDGTGTATGAETNVPSKATTSPPVDEYYSYDA